MSGAAIASERPAIRPESADSLRAETSQIGQVKVNRYTQARVGTNPTDEPITSGLPVVREEYRNDRVI